jgi:hypothetical protein
VILFDASAWTGIWPFAMSAPVTLAELVASLEDAGITGAAVSPLNAVLAPDPMAANLDLLAEANQLASDTFDLRVVPVLDPSLPGWEGDLDTLLETARPLIGAIKAIPNYHGYAVNGPQGVALAKAVTKAGLGLCIQIRLLDERAHHPLMKVPGVPVDGVARLAEAVPEGRFLACGVYQAELARLTAINVSAELSSVESGDALANALAVIGANRLLLGTHAPIYYPAAGVAKVTAMASDDDILIRDASFNAAAFFA